MGKPNQLLERIINCQATYTAQILLRTATETTAMVRVRERWHKIMDSKLVQKNAKSSRRGGQKQSHHDIPKLSSKHSTHQSHPKKPKSAGKSPKPLPIPTMKLLIRTM